MGGIWKSCGEVLKDFDISGIDFLSINGNNESSKYTTEHVKYLIRTVLHHHENYLNPEKLAIQNVDLVVTERCSMKCKDCANLMQYYENPENADLNEMVQTIDSLCEKADEVYEVRVIGGEPFMNKDVHLIIEKLTSKANISKVSIFTNATIVPREHQWEALSHPKVRFFITDYNELSRNMMKLIPALEERKIPYVSEKANGWTDSAALDKHNRSEEENEKVFQSCCAKNLATLHDGNLYRCPFSANASKLKAIPDYVEDYLVVRSSTREQIRSFLRDIPYIHACDHCNGRSYDAPVIQPAIQTKVPLKYFKYGSLENAN
jgi:MoaA/NifB/PqqE/SkfB family radical SAM enzyme